MGLLTKLKSLLGFEDDRSQVRRTESGVTIEREPEESARPDAESESAVKGVDTGTEESFDTDATDEPEVTDDSDATETTAEPEGVEDAAEPTESEATEETAEVAETETTEGIEEVGESEAADETEAETDDETADGESAETGVTTEDVTTAPEAESVEEQRDEAAEPAEATGPSVDAAEPDQSAGDEPEPTPEETPGESPEPDDAADEPVGEGEPLEEVKGIGPAYAERLRDAGVADIAELARADPDQLADETGLSAKRISTWIDRADAR